MLDLSKEPFYSMDKNPPSYLDNSGYSEFTRCPAKYCYSRILSLSLRDPHPALLFGTSIHNALGSLLSESDLPHAKTIFLQTYGDTLDSLRTPQLGLSILEDYARTLLPLPYRVIVPHGSCKNTNIEDSNPKIEIQKSSVSPSEFTFLLDIDMPLPLAGRIDRLASSLESDKTLWLVEFKTTSETGPRFVSQFSNSPQLLLYSIAIKTLFPDLELRGSFVEALRVSSSTRSSIRFPVLFSPHLAESLLHSLSYVSTQISQCYSSGLFPRNLSACTPYAQYYICGYRCPFFPLCHYQSPGAFLDRYSTVEWSPLDSSHSSHSSHKNANTKDNPHALELSCKKSGDNPRKGDQL